MINWLSNSILLILRLKHSMIQKNRFFRRTLRVLEKKILSNSAIVKKID